MMNRIELTIRHVDKVASLINHQLSFSSTIVQINHSADFYEIHWKYLMCNNAREKSGEIRKKFLRIESRRKFDCIFSFVCCTVAVQIRKIRKYLEYRQFFFRYRKVSFGENKRVKLRITSRRKLKDPDHSVTFQSLRSGEKRRIPSKLFFVCLVKNRYIASLDIRWSGCVISVTPLLISPWHYRHLISRGIYLYSKLLSSLKVLHLILSAGSLA